MFSRKHCAIAALLVGIAPARAQSPAADSTVALPGITVTALRYPLPAERAPVRVLRLERTWIATSSSVVAALERHAGLFVRRYGTGLASLSLRGSSPSQTAVLIDGLPLNDPQLGQVDLSLLPLFIVDRIEVVHGAASARYGTGAMAGAVDLRTAPTEGEFAASAVGGRGTFGAGQVGAGVAYASGGWSVRLAGEYRADAGDFPFWNASLFPPRKAPRAGADLAQASVFGHVVRTRVAGRTAIGVFGAFADRGLPGPSTAVPAGERQEDGLHRLWAIHERDDAGGRWRGTVALHQNRLRYTHPRLAIDDEGRNRTASVQLERSGTAGRLAGTVGVGGSTSLARHPHLATSATQAQGAVFASGARDVGTLALFPALRVDAVSAGAWRAAVSPSLGANLRLRDFRLKGQAARAFRAPTLNDLYWQPGGNPSLRPERSTAFDAGASWEPAAPAFRPSLEVTVYTHRIREQIVWLPEASGIWSPRNVARVRARGVEASAEAAPRWGPVRGEARILYTLTDARDRSDPSSAAFDRPLRYVPRHQGKTALAVVLTRGGWEVALDVAGRFTSRRYVTTDASQFVREYAVVDAGGRFGRRIGAARVGVSVALENVFDANYEGIKGYPMPPRRLHVSARIDLRR